MSDLPDDVRRWPSDPFQLLGVPRDVPPRELKRAYTRLIRAYKPEHAPEQFRRIREAYDAVRQFVEMYSDFREDSAARPFEADGPAPVEAVPRVESLDEQLDQCWEWAIDGDEPKAYRALEQLHLQTPHDARLAARLFWLLTLAPELDRGRSPCDWLATGLKHNGISGPLRELYRRELAAAPAEALSDRCAALIDALPASPGLAELAEWRWNAAADTEQAAEIIRADLAKLRERFLSYNDEAWAWLVLAAADRVAFIDSAGARDLLTRCQRDLEALEHLHLRLSAAFDRFELLQDFAIKTRAVLQNGAQWHAEFVDVVRRGWTVPTEELRPRLMAYLATLAARPPEMLQNLDAVQSLAAPLLLQFRHLLARLEAIMEPPDELRAAEDIHEIVLSFARETPGARYDDWRPHLLDFCLREVLAPEQVAAALVDEPDLQLTTEQHLWQAVIADVPLACVCHGCRLFWA